VIRADAELELSGLSWKTLEQLRQLEPHGAGNPRPVLVARAAKVLGAARMGRGAEGEAPPHLKLRLHDQREAAWEAVGWRMGERAGEAPSGSIIDLAFQLEVNEWNGEKRMQLVLQDFRADAPVH
jgi:single-stranded-DNA-specific exonuclease